MHLSLWIVLACVGSSLCPEARAQVSHQQNRIVVNNGSSTLTPGQSYEREMVGGEHHAYRLELPARQYLKVVVQQLGIDVVLTISQLNGRILTEVDRPNGSRGRETISIVTPAAGSYVLDVRSLESVTAHGRYHLRLDSLRDQQTEDDTWIAAEQAVSKAESLRSQSTAEGFHQAIGEFNKAVELWKTINQPYEQALAFYGLGLSCTALSENQKGIEYLSQGLPLFGNDVHGVAITKAALGWPYMYLGDNENAQQSFSEAFQLYHLQGNVRGEGVALYGMGWVEALRGRNREALQKFSDSLTRRQAAKDRRGEALTLTGIGKLEARIGNHTKALGSLNQALALISGRDSYAEADVLSNLGWLHSALKQERDALAFFNRALAVRRQVGDRIGEATTLYGISRIRRRQGHLQEALLAIESAVEIVQSLRTRGASQQLRISYFASIQDYYDYYIGILMDLDKLSPSAGYAARALHASERARARGLIDLLPEAQIDLREGIDSSLLELEQSINEKLNAAANRYAFLGPKHTEEAQRLSDEITELSDQDDAVKARIRNANPRYAALTRPQPLTASQIQQQVLDEDTLLLEYALGEDRSYLWAVTRDEFASYELPRRQEIEHAARQVYDELTARNRVVPGESSKARRARVADADVRAKEGMRQLSRILLSPVAESLNAGNLVIVAPGALQFIPFAALPTPSGPIRREIGQAENRREGRSEESTGKALIVDHEVVMLPSATTLAVIRDEVKKRRSSTKSVAVFADPVYSGHDDRLPVSAANVRAMVRDYHRSPGGADQNGRVDSGFPRLVSSMWEGKKIVDLAPGGQGKRLFLGLAASRATAMSPEIGQYRLLHFASHALIDNEHPELSGIVLSMVDEHGYPRDGFLRSNEIFKLKLSADLVVLSACRSGLGKDFSGEGLVGLTRGFMYAGAPRVVASLWDIEDNSTSELMVRFYRRMLGPEQLAPAAGLRMAQLEMRADPRWQSPYYWAGFILQGEWR